MIILIRESNNQKNNLAEIMIFSATEVKPEALDRKYGRITCQIRNKRSQSIGREPFDFLVKIYTKYFKQTKKTLKNLKNARR